MYQGKIPFPNLNGSITKIDNKEFDLTLKYLEAITPSKKNPNRKRHILVDQNGVKFSMMPQEFQELQAMTGPQINTQFIRAGWTFTKRGDAYGLKFVTFSPGVTPPVATNTNTGRLNSKKPNKSNTPKHDNSVNLSAVVKDANAKNAVAAPPKQRTTLFALCLDSSSSMSSIDRGVTVGAVNSMVKSIKESAKANNQIAKVMLWEFGVNYDDTRVTKGLVNVDAFVDLNINDYQPRGNTPLFKCIGDAIEHFQRMPEYLDDDVSFFVHVLTDGEENASKGRYLPKLVNDMVAKVQATDRWTFAIQVPEGTERHFINQYCVPAGNVQGWKTNDRGLVQASVNNSVAVNNYMVGRSSGLRSSKNVYTTNLANVDLKDIQSKLTDLSNIIKIWKVDKEIDVKTFAEEKTKNPYVIGSIWYQLTKTETIQPQKGILIRVKNTKTVYGGVESRRLIGLDPNDLNNAKVIPGNHSNYDIYVTSTSTNRKLVRGTEVIFLMPQVAMQETWDSQAAKAAADLKKAQSGQPSP